MQKRRRRRELLFVQTVQTNLYLNQGIKAVSIHRFLRFRLQCFKEKLNNLCKTRFFKSFLQNEQSMRILKTEFAFLLKKIFTVKGLIGLK